MLSVDHLVLRFSLWHAPTFIMPDKGPFWDLFYSNKSKYLNNKTYDSAWCKAWADDYIRTQKESELAAAASGLILKARSDEELMKEGVFVDDLIPHHPSSNPMTQALAPKIPRVTIGPVPAVATQGVQPVCARILLEGLYKES